MAPTVISHGVVGTFWKRPRRADHHTLDRPRGVRKVSYEYESLGGKSVVGGMTCSVRLVDPWYTYKRKFMLNVVTVWNLYNSRLVVNAKGQSSRWNVIELSRSLVSKCCFFIMLMPKGYTTVELPETTQCVALPSKNDWGLSLPHFNERKISLLLFFVCSNHSPVMTLAQKALGGLLQGGDECAKHTSSYISYHQHSPGNQSIAIIRDSCCMNAFYTALLFNPRSNWKIFIYYLLKHIQMLTFQARIDSLWSERALQLRLLRGTWHWGTGDMDALWHNTINVMSLRQSTKTAPAG